MNESEPASPAEIAEFWRLTQAYCSDTQSLEDRDRLEAMLWGSAELREKYIEYLAIHAGLKCAMRTFGDGPLPLTQPPPNSSAAFPVLPAQTDHATGMIAPAAATPPSHFQAVKHRRRSSWPFWKGSWLGPAAIVTATVAVIAIWVVRPPRERHERIVAKSSDVVGFARLTRTAACSWSTEHIAPQLGQRIGPEGIELVHGVVEIEFDSGAVVVLEGPARFTPTGPNRAVLTHGKLAAEVPERAAGFVVDTPSTTLVDLGTEFGLAVDPNGVAEAHVFKGAVQIRSSDGDDDQDDVTQLEEGESLRVDFDGKRSGATRTLDTSFQRSVPSEPQLRTVSVSTAGSLGADSYIRRGTKLNKIGSSNFGGDIRLGVKATYKPIDQRKTWLRMELPDKTTPLSQLRRAAIKLTMLADPWGQSVDQQRMWEFEVWGMKDAKHGVQWDEFPSKGGWKEGKSVSARTSGGASDRGKRDAKSLTWNNAGGNDAQSEGLLPDYFVLVGKFSIEGPSVDGKVIEISTPHLRNFIADDSNGLVSFVVLRKTSQPSKSESTIHWFASKENKSFPAPQLILSYDPK